jgi:hypothetical protein
MPRGPHYRLLVTGSRHWTDADTIRRVLSDYPPESWALIHGSAPGADRIAHRIARDRGYFTVSVEPPWTHWGKAAGPLRNVLMLDLRPHVVLAFHEDLASSRGTLHCVETARKRSIPVRVFQPGG